MKINENFLGELKRVTKEENILLNEMMKNHTNFKLGGPADVLVTPESKDELINIISLAKKHNIPFFIIGNGSNLIVKDGGIRGAVIKLEKIKGIELLDGNAIKAECGILLKDISMFAMEKGLSGMEFACGIPGSLGGAVYMNAGAYNHEMKEVLESVTVIDDNNEIREIKRENLELAYRTSIVKQKNYIVIDATMVLTPRPYEAIKERVDDLTLKRETNQPLEMPSAGSTFKRPEGYFAAKLIQDAGLKGFKHKGAQVSPKHSGFVVNCDNATATEVLELIEIIQKTVMEKFGVALEREVLIIGEDL